MPTSNETVIYKQKTFSIPKFNLYEVVLVGEKTIQEIYNGKVINSIEFKKLVGIKVSGSNGSIFRFIVDSGSLKFSMYPIICCMDKNGNYFEVPMTRYPNNIGKFLIEFKKNFNGIIIDNTFSHFISPIQQLKIFGKFTKLQIFWIVLIIILLAALFGPFLYSDFRVLTGQVAK